MARYRWVFVGMCLVLSMGMVTGCKKNKISAPGRLGVGSDTEVLGGFGDPNYLSMSGKQFDLGTPVSDVSFQAVSFAYDSYQLDPSEYGKIDLVSQYMNENADTVLVTEGHCDERGSREYNMALGENRAQAVRAYLINAGIGAERIQTRSHGEEVPIDFGHTESAWAQNRRVEFSLFR